MPIFMHLIISKKKGRTARQHVLFVLMLSPTVAFLLTLCYTTYIKSKRGNGMNVNPTEGEIRAVREGLDSFNRASVGADGHTPLNIVEYDGGGSVIGGLLGGTYWGWMYVDILWVQEAHRGTGIGTRLLAAAEKEAKRRGCHHVHLDTMSWQAPAFYQKRGYEVIGILPDIPTGNQKYLLMKAL